METDKNEAIQSGLFAPHYNNDRFRNTAQTVFLSPEHTLSGGRHPKVEAASYEYSDRLVQHHGHTASDLAWKAAEAKGLEKRSASFIEEYLRVLLRDLTIELVHIIAGVNVGNGYSYRVYGYIRSKKSKK